MLIGVVLSISGVATAVAMTSTAHPVLTAMSSLSHAMSPYVAPETSKRKSALRASRTPTVSATRSAMRRASRWSPDLAREMTPPACLDRVGSSAPPPDMVSDRKPSRPLEDVIAQRAAAGVDCQK